jgi:hypothetical protein
MAATALVVWIMTALSGLLMLGTSLGVTRPAQQPARRATPSFLMFIHPAFALAGAVVWAMFLAFDERPLAWIAFLDLVLVAGLGDVLLVGWLRGRRRRHEPERPVDRTVGQDETSSHGGGVQVRERVAVPTLAAVAEHRIPPVLVAAHGGLALVTVVLVLLSALGLG